MKCVRGYHPDWGPTAQQFEETLHLSQLANYLPAAPAERCTHLKALVHPLCPSSSCWPGSRRRLIFRPLELCRTGATTALPPVLGMTFWSPVPCTRLPTRAAPASRACCASRRDGVAVICVQQRPLEVVICASMALAVAKPCPSEGSVSTEHAAADCGAPRAGTTAVGGATARATFAAVGGTTGRATPVTARRAQPDADCGAAAPSTGSAAAASPGCGSGSNAAAALSSESPFWPLVVAALQAARAAVIALRSACIVGRNI
jgi:hypothetical protein